MENRFVDIRVETIKNFDNFVERLKHNTRYKKDKRVVKPHLGFMTRYGQINGFKSEYSKKQLNKFDKIFYDETLKEVKSLNKQFREKRNPVLAEGLLYFSKGINDDYINEPGEFKKRLESLLTEFEERNKTKVFDYQIHTDEEGNTHVHFMFKNFNQETGKSLNFTRSKENGSWLQDLAHQHFGSFGKGYKRGIKKEKTTKHLSIEEYKELQESKKLLKNTKIELLELQKELRLVNGLNDKLKAQNERLNEQKEELEEIRNDTRKDILLIQGEFEEMIEDFEDFLLSETDKEKLEKIKSLFGRYSKNENKERLLKHLDKSKKTLNKFKNKYTRKEKR